MFDVGLPPVAELKIERRFFNIMNSIKILQARGSALMVALLMVFSMASGVLCPAGGGFALAPTAVMAQTTGGNTGGNAGGKTVDNLWDTISDDGTSVGGDLDSADVDMGTAVQTSKKVAQAITSILTVISFVSFLFWVAKLAMSAGNPQTRRVAISGILFSGIALALFGGAWVAVSFFWNLLSGVA